MALTKDQKFGLFLAGTGILAWLLGRHRQPEPLPATAPRRTASPQRPTPDAGIQIIIPLQDPRTSLTNTNDPVKDRAVRDVLSAQLDSIGAPANADTVIRATSWLASRGSPAPTLPTMADALYWAARKINTYVEQSFYRTTLT